MAESEVAAMAAAWHFCNGSISENVYGSKLYKHTKLYAVTKNLMIHLKFVAHHLD